MREFLGRGLCWQYWALLGLLSDIRGDKIANENRQTRTGIQRFAGHAIHHGSGHGELLYDDFMKLMTRRDMDLVEIVGA